jgi:predicted AAA+ superfamily ATPase
MREEFYTRLDSFLCRIEALLPEVPPAPDWETVSACRWSVYQHEVGGFQAVPHPHAIHLQDLHNIAHQRDTLERNTKQFVQGLPANNALLWGSKGTGKSSLIKALLNAYAYQGLRLIEVDKADLRHVPRIVEQLHGLPQRFILFCDDLSFESGESSYKELKSLLDGSIGVAPENVLVYATSNRRHLLPEYQSDNRDAHLFEGELHHGEAVEEKISLSERFGLWLSFYPFKQDEYLDIVAHWCRHFDVEMNDVTRQAALQWALARGSRSGRVAWQFARDWAGQLGLEG